jgi:hypothetical protein
MEYHVVKFMEPKILKLLTQYRCIRRVLFLSSDVHVTVFLPFYVWICGIHTTSTPVLLHLLTTKACSAYLVTAIMLLCHLTLHTHLYKYLT